MSRADELFKMWVEKPTRKSDGFSERKSKEKPKKETKTEAEKSVKNSKKQTTKKPEKKSEEKSAYNNSDRNFMKAVESIQKNAKKTGVSEEKSTFMQDGKLIILDGHRILRAKYPFITAKEVENPLETKKFFEAAYQNCDRKMQCPTIPELKALIKGAKEEACKGLDQFEIKRAKRHGKLKRVLYRFENGLTVNADYLLDAINLTGKSEFRCNSENVNVPILFESDDGIYEHILLPVHSEFRKGEHEGECFVA